jgi:hypothetical protein
MIRATTRAEVLYGHYRDYAECLEELNKLLAERGMKQWQLLSPTSGKDNIIVASCDYSRYEEMKSDQDRFQSDAECMKVFRSGAQFIVQGSSESEILEDVPRLA